MTSKEILTEIYNYLNDRIDMDRHDKENITNQNEYIEKIGSLNTLYDIKSTIATYMKNYHDEKDECQDGIEALRIVRHHTGIKKVDGQLFLTDANENIISEITDKECEILERCLDDNRIWTYRKIDGNDRS